MNSAGALPNYWPASGVTLVKLHTQLFPNLN